MWIVMVQHKTSDQYLTSGKVSTKSIHGFKRYRLLKTLKTEQVRRADADSNVDADADAVVTAIALPVLSYRRAKKRKKFGVLYQFFISLSLEPHLLYDYTTSKIVAIQVMIFTQFTCGKYGKSDLHADSVCTFIFPY